MIYQIFLLISLTSLSVTGLPFSTSLTTNSANLPGSGQIPHTIIATASSEFGKRQHALRSTNSGSTSTQGTTFGNPAIVTQLPSLIHRNFIITPKATTRNLVTSTGNSVVTAAVPTFTSSTTTNPDNSIIVNKNEPRSMIHRRNVLNTRLSHRNNVVPQGNQQQSSRSRPLTSSNFNIVNHANRVTHTRVAGGNRGNAQTFRQRGVVSTPTTTINNFGGNRFVVANASPGLSNQKVTSTAKQENSDGTRIIVVSPSSGVSNQKVTSAGRQENSNGNRFVVTSNLQGLSNQRVISAGKQSDSEGNRSVLSSTLPGLSNQRVTSSGRQEKIDGNRLVLSNPSQGLSAQKVTLTPTGRQGVSGQQHRAVVVNTPTSGGLVLSSGAVKVSGTRNGNTPRTTTGSSGGHARANGVASSSFLAASDKPQHSECAAGFTVKKGLSKPNEKSSTSRIYFQDIVTNVGGWDPSGQQFVAPCPGLYYFSFHAVSTKKADFTIALMKEGEYQVTAYGGKEGYQWGSNSALLSLSAGEKVYLELQQGAIYEHPEDEAYVTFTGFGVGGL